MLPPVHCLPPDSFLPGAVFLFPEGRAADQGMDVAVHLWALQLSGCLDENVQLVLSWLHLDGGLLQGH